MENISLSNDEYKGLKEAAGKYWALEEFGVDNWNGYDEAMKSYRDNLEPNE